MTYCRGEFCDARISIRLTRESPLCTSNQNVPSGKFLPSVVVCSRITSVGATYLNISDRTWSPIPESHTVQYQTGHCKKKSTHLATTDISIWKLFISYFSLLTFQNSMWITKKTLCKEMPMNLTFHPSWSINNKWYSWFLRVISFIKAIEFLNKIVIKAKYVAQEKFWVLVCTDITKKEAPRICGKKS